ncbi:uncharacterized protein LOC143021931 isoform X3 [Oratosquilla oratoria]|uniref:uncharacterized protein LOC143021931 isoform X3 n=1 Tax=Oratosquilla oratoria TaxID=337810 RepID=UPI003F7663EC
MNNLFISESSQSSDDFKIILVELKSLSSVQLEADADFAKLLEFCLTTETFKPQRMKLEKPS